MIKRFMTHINESSGDPEVSIDYRSKLEDAFQELKDFGVEVIISRDPIYEIKQATKGKDGIKKISWYDYSVICDYSVFGKLPTSEIINSMKEFYEILNNSLYKVDFLILDEEYFNNRDMEISLSFDTKYANEYRLKNNILL